MNRLLSKRVLSIHLKVTIAKEVTYSKLGISKFENIVSRSIFGELQLKQVSLLLVAP